MPVAEFLPDAGSVARTATHHASRGARVLVICNTMADTLATAQAIDRLDGRHLLRVHGQPVAYHSHYTAEDRHIINDAAIAAMGDPAIVMTAETGSTKAAIVVATSQVDNGLHLDADVLVTSVAPVDVLVRRLGRLHALPDLRRPKGYDKPLLFIVAPPIKMFIQGVGPKGEAHRLSMGFGSVYRDMAVLHRTWENLQKRGGIDRGRPRTDIEEARHPYHMKWLKEAGTRWVEHDRWLARRQERIAVVAASLRWSQQGGAFGTRDCDVQTSSALGEPSEVYIEDNVMRVYFAGIESPLGTPMRQLDVRACGSLKAGQRVDPTKTDAGWSFGEGTSTTTTATGGSPRKTTRLRGRRLEETQTIPKCRSHACVDGQGDLRRHFVVATVVPTRAWMDREEHAPELFTRSHPARGPRPHSRSHACVDGPRADAENLSVAASFPRVRGWTAPEHSLLPFKAVVPTRAWMDRPKDSSFRRGSGRSHVRVDVPMAKTWRLLKDASFPRVRGCPAPNAERLAVWRPH